MVDGGLEKSWGSLISRFQDQINFGRLSVRLQLNIYAWCIIPRARAGGRIIGGWEESHSLCMAALLTVDRDRVSLRCLVLLVQSEWTNTDTGSVFAAQTEAVVLGAWSSLTGDRVQSDWADGRANWNRSHARGTRPRDQYEYLLSISPNACGL